MNVELKALLLKIWHLVRRLSISYIVFTYIWSIDLLGCLLSLLMLVLLSSRPTSPFCWPKDNCLFRLCSLRIGSLLSNTLSPIDTNPLLWSIRCLIGLLRQSYLSIGSWSSHHLYLLEKIVCSDKHKITLTPKHQQTTSEGKEMKIILKKECEILVSGPDLDCHGFPTEQGYS